jgi:uncharacterized protein YjeT (DUF2065 family)
MLAVEGALYAFFPEQTKRMARFVLAQPSSTVRTLGLVGAATGLALLWLALR